MTKRLPSWVEISIEGPVFILEALADFLNTIGAGGAIFSEAKNKKPGYECLTAFLNQDARLPYRLNKLQKYLAELSALFPEQKISEPEIKGIIAQDWINQWRQSVVPTRVSKKFWVVPEWQTPPAQACEPGMFCIIMEPGLAFGTGYHPTTQLCLEFIEKLVPEKARTVLDLGTGTGILAMASAMLGAEKILALEIEELALEVARDNFRRNQLEDKIELRRATPRLNRSLSKTGFDLILANLHLAELKRLANYLVRALKHKGYLVISGILPEQASEILRLYRKKGMRIIEKREKARWLAILMKKN